mmetsp:Transcript_7339/g.12553  ORF Transcript_7339/g.12553 Transcript_7339/m.12553 type:complete len:354 (+) Transcript_7339:65-1126(+)
MEGQEGVKLFLGGLSWDTTEDALREYFSSFGEISEVLVMRERQTNKPRGFGFVTFRDSSAADRAVGASHTIDGRQVEAKRATPQGQTPQSKGSEPTAKTKKIFVGGLAPSVEEGEFRSYFEAYGKVVDAVVMYDRDTRRPRGFGFITFENESSVDAVMKKQHTLGDKTVEIKRAEPKQSSSSRSAPSSGNGYGSGYDGGYSSRPSYSSRSGSYVRGSSDSRGSGGYGSGGGYGAGYGGGYGSGNSDRAGYAGAAYADTVANYGAGFGGGAFPSRLPSSYGGGTAGAGFGGAYGTAYDAYSGFADGAAAGAASAYGRYGAFDTPEAYGGGATGSSGGPYNRYSSQRADRSYRPY